MNMEERFIIHYVKKWEYGKKNNCFKKMEKNNQTVKPACWFIREFNPGLKKNLTLFYSCSQSKEVFNKKVVIKNYFYKIIFFPSLSAL